MLSGLYKEQKGVLRYREAHLSAIYFSFAGEGSSLFSL